MARDKLAPRGPAFEALLNWLNPDRERAADEYVRLHRRFAKMFEARGCPGPEECADETFNRVGHQLVEGKEIRTNNPAVYLDGVARHILRELWNKPAHEPIEEVPPAKLKQDQNRELEERLEGERRHICLEDCLKAIPEESRILLLEYYAADKTLKIQTRERMALRLGIDGGVLRNRIFRLRKSLRLCVSTCLSA